MNKKCHFIVPSQYNYFIRILNVHSVLLNIIYMINSVQPITNYFTLLTTFIAQIYMYLGYIIFKIIFLSWLNFLFLNYSMAMEIIEMLINVGIII